MAYEQFPGYPTLADALEDAQKIRVVWGHAQVRDLSPGQVEAIVAALRGAAVSEKGPRDLTPSSMANTLREAAAYLTANSDEREAEIAALRCQSAADLVLHVAGRKQKEMIDG